MRKAKLLINTAIIASIAAISPAFMSDQLRQTLNVSPVYIANIPWIDTPEKKTLKDITLRFQHSPDVVHAMALNIAIDPDYPIHLVEALDADLLSDAYSGDHVTLPDGTQVATYNSILSEALRSKRFDIVEAHLKKTGAKVFVARQLALQEALLQKHNPDRRDTSRKFFEIFARNGGSAVATRNPRTDETLAEILLGSDHQSLMYFVAEGFDPFTSMDPDLIDAGGISLGEIATLKGDDDALRGVAHFLQKGGVPAPDLKVSANMLANLLSREGLSDEFNDLVAELQLRSTPIDTSK